MVVDVLAVCVGGNEKGVSALCPAHGRFIAYPVCLLRGDFPRLEGLADLIAEHIRVPLLLPARDGLVLGLCQKKLGVGCAVVTLIAGDQLTALGLVRVLPVVKAVFEALNDCPLGGLFVGLEIGCGYERFLPIIRQSIKAKQFDV